MKNQDYNYNSLIIHSLDSPKTSFARNIYHYYTINNSISIIRENKIINYLKIIEINRKNIITAVESHKDSINILLRKTVENLKKCHKNIYSFDRNLIIRRLILILKEEIPYNIHKIDIKSFYESFDKDFIKNKINSIEKLSPVSKKFLTDIIDFSPSGLPRGLSISSTLSDILMSDFDKDIMLNENIFFYSRFVDDIIIISSNKVDSLNIFRNQLYKTKKLKINTEKSRSIILEEEEEIEFQYLGYNFKLKKDKEIIIDIAKNKIKKIKKKIVKSLIDYKKNKNELLLVNRIKFLSSAYKIYITKDKKYIKSGIRFNYPELSDNSNSLKEIDNFFYSAILGKNKRIGKIIHDKKLIRTLHSISFHRFYSNNIFFKFSFNEIVKIRECWKND